MFDSKRSMLESALNIVKRHESQVVSQFDSQRAALHAGTRTGGPQLGALSDPRGRFATKRRPRSAALQVQRYDSLRTSFRGANSMRSGNERAEF